MVVETNRMVAGKVKGESREVGTEMKSYFIFGESSEKRVLTFHHCSACYQFACRLGLV